MDTNITPNSTQIAEAVASSRLDTVSSSGLRDRRPSERRPSFVNRSQLFTAGLSPLSSVIPPKEDSAVGEEEDIVVIAAQTKEEDLKKPVTLDDSPIAYPPTAASTPLVYERSNPFTLPSEAPAFTPGTTPGTLTPALTRMNEPLIKAELRAERHTIRLASAFLSFFSCGWADGTPGTIIPHLEEAYRLSHFKVSTLFIAGAIGFGIGTFINEPFIIHTGQFPLDSTKRIFIPPPFQRIALKRPASEAASGASGHSVALGRFWTLMFGCLCQILYYTIAVSDPPFGALCLAFCFGGIAISIFSGQMNAYVAGASGKRNQGRELGYLHGSYGIGAFASPLICQTLLAAGWSWHRFYWTSFGFSILNALLMITAFHPTKKEWETDREAGLLVHELEQRSGAQTVEGQNAAPVGEIEMQVRGAKTGSKGGRTKPKSTMQLALRMPYVWLFMAFLGFYTGSETTTGGWIVTYLLKQRNANPDTVGYVASGKY
ncbi:hypothetical protein FRB90_009595 [Tulasnella sp. 427]|nr:hypothetical protein FRB90_009595 [Tulasnella sp. 427]